MYSSENHSKSFKTHRRADFAKKQKQPKKIIAHFGEHLFIYYRLPWTKMYFMFAVSLTIVLSPSQSPSKSMVVHCFLCLYLIMNARAG